MSKGNCSREVWKDVVGYEGLFQVSNLGRVKSVERIIKRKQGVWNNGLLPVKERIRKLSIRGMGYWYVSLHKNNKSKSHPVHRVVLEAFIGPCPPMMECCHSDGNKLNARLDNLRWDTHRNNNADQRIHGTLPWRHRNPITKLFSKDVKRVKRLYATGKYAQRELAEMYDVHPNTIWYALKEK